MTRSALGIALCVCLSAPRLAHADDPPSKEQVTKARAKFRAAEVARVAGEFNMAATGYIEAYKALPDAEFLFNAGQMYILAGDLDSARIYLEKYLAEDPDGRAVAEARRALATLPPPSAPAGTETTGAIAEQPVEPSSLTATPRDEPPAGSPGRGLRIAGLITMSGGVVALGAGAVFGLRARSISDEAADWDVFERDRHAEGERAEKWMLVFTGAGAAAVITGGVVYYLGRRARGRAESTVAATAIVGGGVTGVAIEGTF